MDCFLEKLMAALEVKPLLRDMVTVQGSGRLIANFSPAEPLTAA
jgi:hypothetical protein